MTAKLDIHPRDKFNKLTVFSLSPKKQNTAVTWTCLCDCGNFTDATSSQLKTGGKKSCGCAKKGMKNIKCYENLSPQIPREKVCKNCRKTFLSKTSRIYCSLKCKLYGRLKHDRDCLIWSKTITDNRYRILYDYNNRSNRRYYVHKLMYELSFRSIPNNKVVRQKCNNFLCCNPNHLYLDDKKSILGNTSRKALNVFTSIAKWLKTVYGITSIFNDGIMSELCLVDETKRFYYDFTIPEYKIIIEYNRRVWHPISESDSQYVQFHEKMLSTQEAFLRDKHKKILAEQNGYTLLTFWDDVSISETIESIKEKLESLIGKKLE